jgi:ribosomal protein L7/L12
MRQSEDPRDRVIAQLQERMSVLENAIPTRPAFAAYVYDGLVRELADALENDKKIDAIKYYRGISGSGLIEAKDFIEAVQGKRKVDAIKLHKAVSGCGLREAKEFVESIMRW